MILNNIDNLIQITENRIWDGVKGFFANSAAKAALKETENKLQAATSELERIRNRDKNIGKAFTATTGLGLAGTGGYLYGRKENQDQHQPPQHQMQPPQQNTIPPMDDRKKLAIGAGLVGAAGAGSLLMNRQKRDDN